MNRRKILGAICGVASVMEACAPQLRELGDEPLGGGGGSVATAGGSAAGRAGSSASVGGAGGAVAEMPRGGSPSGGGQAGSGASPSAGNAGEGGQGLGDCFAPQHQPELGLEQGSVGCPCEADPPECVRTEHDNRPWDVALVCTNGTWESVEDGPCSGRSACEVNGVTYPSGARRVPSPYNDCSSCGCDDGKLVECGGLDCLDQPCAAGSWAARRCAICGLADGCDVVEIGCFTDPDCEDGVCGVPCP